MPQPNFKVTRKELANILGVHRNTAAKEYRIIQDCLGLKRALYAYDLVKYGILNAQ